MNKKIQTMSYMPLLLSKYVYLSNLMSPTMKILTRNGHQRGCTVHTLAQRDSREWSCKAFHHPTATTIDKMRHNAKKDYFYSNHLNPCNLLATLSAIQLFLTLPHNKSLANVQLLHSKCPCVIHKTDTTVLQSKRKTSYFFR